MRLICVQNNEEVGPPVGLRSPAQTSIDDA